MQEGEQGVTLIHGSSRSQAVGSPASGLVVPSSQVSEGLSLGSH